MELIISSIIGILSSILPEITSIFSKKVDNSQTLKLEELKKEILELKETNNLEALSKILENKEDVKRQDNFYSGVKWVDALNGFVRPFITLSFFILYAGIKVAMITDLTSIGSTPMNTIGIIWTIEDQMLFTGVISYFFGKRSFEKLKK